MATSSVAVSETEFELELAKVRIEIQSHFGELVKSVRTRESELLKEVDTILTKFKEKVKEKDKMKIELDKTKQLIQQNIQLPGLMSLQQDIMKKIEESLNKIKGEMENWEISFAFDTYLNQNVKRQGHVSIKSPFHKQIIPPIDYAAKLQPMKSFGSVGKAPGQFTTPWCIAFDFDKNMYITDHDNNKVQVFSQECKYFFKFGDDGRMNSPIGITLYQEKVFVVQFNGSCILVYNLNGTYIQTVGEGQLTYPYGIDINKVNGDIYVCDSGNNRIQVFTQEFSLKASLFGDVLKKPYDINLTEDSIFVLDSNDPCMHIYNYNNVLIRNIVKRSSQYVFCLDSVNNICMVDYNSGCVMVFDIEGTLIHQFGRFTRPRGIAITNNSNVIICSDTPAGNCIQIW